MEQTKNRKTQELAAMVQDAVKDLGANAVAALVAHPNALRSALADVVEAFSKKDAVRNDVETIGSGEARRVNAEEAERRLSARTQPGPKEELLTSDELAARAGLKTRQSVHNWLRKGRIIGWQGAKRGYVFPAGQFDERGQPMKGLDQTLACFGDDYAAWVWFTTPNAALDGATPLARLRKGEAGLVAAVARGYAQGDFA